MMALLYFSVSVSCDSDSDHLHLWNVTSVCDLPHTVSGPSSSRGDWLTVEGRQLIQFTRTVNGSSFALFSLCSWRPSCTCFFSSAPFNSSSAPTYPYTPIDAFIADFNTLWFILNLHSVINNVVLITISLTWTEEDFQEYSGNVKSHYWRYSCILFFEGLLCNLFHTNRISEYTNDKRHNQSPW